MRLSWSPQMHIWLHPQDWDIWEEKDPVYFWSVRVDHDQWWKDNLGRLFMINSGNPGNLVVRWGRESWWWTLGRACWVDPQMIPLLLNLVRWVSPSTPHMKRRCRQKVENIPVFCLFPKTRVSLSGLDMWPLLLTRWRRIRECLERENGVKGHSSLGGETRNRRFVGGRKYLELLSLELILGQGHVQCICPLLELCTHPLGR